MSVMVFNYNFMLPEWYVNYNPLGPLPAASADRPLETTEPFRLNIWPLSFFLSFFLTIPHCLTLAGLSQLLI